MNLNGIRQIGQIFNSHGVRGEIKFEAQTGYPEDLIKLKELFLIKDDQRVAYDVLAIRQVKNHWLLKLKGIDDMDTAKSLKGYGLYCDEALLRPLEDDEFYLDDLYDSKVYSTEGEYLGIITDYFDNGEHGVCEVTDGEDTFMFPTTEEVMKDVVPGEKVVIFLLPNLRDLNK